MNSSDQIDQFLSRVTSHIRSKEAKELVDRELRSHIEKRIRENKDKGSSHVEAATLAVEQMGSPSSLGRVMNQLHKPKVDWLIIGLFSLLLGAGMMPVLFFTPWMGGSSYSLISGKLFMSAVSLAVVLGIMFLDYRPILKAWPRFYWGSLSLIILFFISGNFYNGQVFFRLGDHIRIDSWFVAMLCIIGLVGLVTERKGKKYFSLTVTAAVWVPALFFGTFGSISVSILSVHSDDDSLCFIEEQERYIQTSRHSGWICLFRLMLDVTYSSRIPAAEAAILD
ncbi:permease prefix domain 1-containing protein [Alteribacter salitolerans]|uniref:permease prefix domain 1-containing protein n=1 Tax=Alteribacter salitolerans TaxID=2912333 RepID=UPI0030138136